MKSNGQPSLYFSPHSLKGHKEPVAKPSTQSPYLKDVLSGKTRRGTVKMEDSNMAAALRYISSTRH